MAVSDTALRREAAGTVHLALPPSQQIGDPSLVTNEPPHARRANFAAEAGFSQLLKELADEPTLPRMVLRGIKARRGRPVLRQKVLGIWQETSWESLETTVREVALGFASLGLEPGDVGSILGSTSREWLFADLGLLCAGCVSSGVYPTDAQPQVRFLLADSRSRVVVVEDDEQLDKVLAVRSHA